MRTRIACVIVCTVTLTSLTHAEEAVYFADPGLKAAVEDELYIADPTPADMLTLTYLNAQSRGISDIAGLQYATNLQELLLRWNQISDLSVLTALVNLRSLDAHGNHSLHDLSPLAGLANLEELVLRINRISDLSPLAGLTRLETLDLQWNDVCDLSPLAGLANLRELRLRYNGIDDLSPLAALARLEYVDLRGNPLNQDAYDLYIPKIMANNPGVDLDYNKHGQYYLAISSTAGGSVVRPGEGQFVYGNGEIVYLEAKPDPHHTFVGWSGSISNSANPVFLVVQHDFDIRANFASVLKSLYVDDDTPGDPAEDGTAEHPFDSIQKAIDVAADGTTIFVRPGTYHENVNLVGRNLQLRGVDPEDPNRPTMPVIDGGGNGPAVSFISGEDPNCMVAGFVITGGRDQAAGAIVCSQSSPVIANCLIVGNLATAADGAAVYCTDSNAVFVNCTIADNLGVGLMLIDSHVMVTNSILWANGPNEIALGGNSVATITYTDVAGGWPDVGNIDADPLFVRPGHWLEGADPKAPVWIMGDYHLKSRAGRWDPNDRAWVPDDVTSPCIDAGDPAAPVGLEPHPNGNIVNMGVYGGTIEASRTQLGPD
jgi:hypothetical protein